MSYTDNRQSGPEIYNYANTNSMGSYIAPSHPTQPITVHRTSNVQPVTINQTSTVQPVNPTVTSNVQPVTTTSNNQQNS